MKNERGLTIIELMIVVAIVGILAAMAVFAYNRYITSAQIERLNQMAMELQSGQERFRSRNNVYWSGATWSAGTKSDFVNLLDFKTNVPDDVTVDTEGWTGTAGTCTICAGAPFDDTQAGFAVRVMRDFNTTTAEETTVVITNDTANPILLNEGE